MTDNNNAEVKTVAKVFENDLHIPIYQRPYRWKNKHVLQLLNDINYFRKHKPDVAYRIGTIVLHQNKDNNHSLEIVDGQQRLITLALLEYAIDKNCNNKLLKSINTKDWPNFKNSKKSIYENFKLIESWISDFQKDEKEYNDFKNFLNGKCEVVVITLTEVEEAFQFFDSQNSRGKELYPHDLLKAYHLRRMQNEPDEKLLEMDTKWMEMGEERLKMLFGKYLYHIKRWCQNKGIHKKPFTKETIDYFKGIDPSTPYHQLSKTAQHTCLTYATYEILEKLPISLNSLIQKPSSIYQIDTPVMEGYHFFKMVEYYDRLLREWVEEYAELTESKAVKFQQCEFVPKWLKGQYSGMHRTGDRTVRNLFDNALVYYIDKFEEQNLHQAIRYLVNYSYSLRFEHLRINSAQIDRERKTWFTTLRFSIDERDLPIAENGWLGNIHKDKEKVKSLNQGLLQEIFTEKEVAWKSIELEGIYDATRE